MRQVYPGRYDPQQLLSLKRDEGVTFSHCVSTILRMLLDALPAGADSLAPWTMIIGGGPLPPALWREARDRGISCVGGYGMSETGPVVALSRAAPDDPPEIHCRAGQPVPLVQARIQPPAGGSDGELVLRAPWLTQDYAGAPEAGQALWAGGWLHTQDVARKTGDGALEIVDRLKDVIKTGGEWISSAQLEALCLLHPAVAEAAFVGLPHPRWGERPFAVVVARGAAPTLADLRSHLQVFVDTGTVSRFALPDGLRVVESLPRTSVGKLDKKAARLLAQAVLD